jgi:signal transduction histidine kinase
MYAAVFMVAGCLLLALTYGLLASRLPNTGPSTKQVALRAAPLLARCKQEASLTLPPAGGPTTKLGKGELANTKPAPGSLSQQCKKVFVELAQAASHDRRQATLNSLLTASLIGLAVTTIVAAGLGWLLARRALAPVRAITDTARRASELHLGERLALTGPEDELKELADTFDVMLARLDAAFVAQKRFVANAAHELRTPLTAMRTAIEVTLTKPSRTPEQLEEMAAKVSRSLEHAEATIEALLTLATSEHGPATHEAVDLATAAEDAIDAAGPAIARLELAVDAELAPAPCTGDRVLLERMIANLVDNAVRHNTRQGWIAVHTGVEDGAARFAIANSGPVVREEDIPALFEPFGRAEQRLNPAEGVGLGLSIADAIGRAHGATLVAHSRPDGGLDVSVTLCEDSQDGSGVPR